MNHNLKLTIKKKYKQKKYINRPARGEFYCGNQIHLTPPTLTQINKRCNNYKSKNYIVTQNIIKEYETIIKED